MKRTVFCTIRKLDRKKIFHRISQIVERIKIVYPEKFNLKENQKYMILAPHPDDESIGCGGFLIKHGRQTCVVCLTDGGVRDGNLPREQRVTVRRQEFIDAMKTVKVENYTFLDIEDGRLLNSYEEFKQIDVNGYDYLFIPNFLDQHPDHKAVSRLLKRLLSEKGYSKKLKIVFYEIWGALPLVNRFIDLKGLLNSKKELIGIYKSQTKTIDYADKIISLNRYRGITVYREAVEAFLVLSADEFMNLL